MVKKDQLKYILENIKFLHGQNLSKLSKKELFNLIEKHILPLLEISLDLPITKFPVTVKMRHLKGAAFLDYLNPKKLYQKLANAYRSKNCGTRSRKLLLGEIHPFCQNFEGPGTKIDLPEVANFPPYNDIDECSRIHDVEYAEAFKNPDKKIREKMVRDADDKVLKCYDKFPNEEGYSLGKLGIESKIKIEDLIPFLAKRFFGNYKGGSIRQKIKQQCICCGLFASANKSKKKCLNCKRGGCIMIG